MYDLILRTRHNPPRAGVLGRDELSVVPAVVREMAELVRFLASLNLELSQRWETNHLSQEHQVPVGYFLQAEVLQAGHIGVV